MKEPKVISKDYIECYVAFLDVLGFKDIVQACSHEHLKTVYQKFNDTVHHGLSNGKYAISRVGGVESIGPDVRKATVNSLLISDSILLWTDDDSAESFNHIVSAVRNLIALSIVDGIPLRGAISVGSLTMTSNQLPSRTHNVQHSLFGRPIVEASKLEKNQEWCGCEITNSAIDRYKKRCPGSESLIEKRQILPYSVPRKNSISNAYVIDWVNHPQTEIDRNVVMGAFAAPPPKNPDSDDWKKKCETIKTKLANTLEFVESVKSSEKESFVPWRSRH